MPLSERNPIVLLPSDRSARDARMPPLAMMSDVVVNSSPSAASLADDDPYCVGGCSCLSAPMTCTIVSAGRIRLSNHIF